MPNGVALTTRSADPTASARARSPGGTTEPARPASAAAVAARSGVRLRTEIWLAPPSARASTTARAAPPAPITTHRRPAGVKSAPRASDATKPSPSVLVPRSTPSVRTMQFTASSRCATSVHSSTRATTSALWGMVTESPLMSARRMASSASAA